MPYYDIAQGTAEWRKLRSGRPTATGFSKIITPKTVKLSTSADAYENRLVAELLTGNPIDDFRGTYEMERGKELEGEAFSFYEQVYGGDIKPMGFVTNDAETIGCSPDALVGTVGGVELKTPGYQTHVGYLLSETGAYDDYKCQVQGSLLVTGRKWWDIMSYCPDIKPSVYRAYRDEEFIEKLSQALEQFTANVKMKLEKIKAM